MSVLPLSFVHWPSLRYDMLFLYEFYFVLFYFNYFYFYFLFFLFILFFFILFYLILFNQIYFIFLFYSLSSSYMNLKILLLSPVLIIYCSILINRMKLHTCLYTFSYFCHLFTDPCWGRACFFLYEFYFI